MLFSKPSKSIGIDIGTHSVKTVLMSGSGKRRRVDQVGYCPVDRTQMNADPILAQADAVVAALANMPVKQSLLVGALPGQTTVIRYPRLPNMPKDQIRPAIETEAGQSIPYDLSEVFLDWALLDTVKEGSEEQLKLLLVAARYEVIESRVQAAEAAGIQYSMLSVDSLALADVAEVCGLLHPDETVAMIDLGVTSTTIHFLKDGVSNFVRDVTWGSRELIQSLVKHMRCDYDTAERELETFKERSAEEPEEAPDTTGESLAGDPGESLDLGSGGSLLDPLDDELAELSAAPQAKEAAAPASTENASAEMLSVPLSRFVTEIRRSFDYYEQQLYERPVDRIILSGGASHLPLVRATIMAELGVENVEVADPSAGDLRFSNDSSIETLRAHPAQFMVALGLAARGTQDL